MGMFDILKKPHPSSMREYEQHLDGSTDIMMRKYGFERRITYEDKERIRKRLARDAVCSKLKRK